MIAGKLDSLDEKMSAFVTTHDQVQEAKNDILDQFEKNVSELKAAFERLVKENVEVRSRVDELERKLQALATGKVSGPDVVFKRLSFIS